MTVHQPTDKARRVRLNLVPRLVVFIIVVMNGSVGLKSQPSKQSLDNTIRFWSVSDGKEIKLPVQERRNINSLAYSPDGKTLAGGMGDSTIDLWDARTGKLRLTLTGHTQSVESVAFSPNGSLLASASYDKTIKLWDVANGRTVKTLSGQTEGILSIAFSPDGKYLASGSEDHSAVVFEVGTGSVALSLNRHQGAVTSVAFSPDSRILATASRDKTVRLWNIPHGEQAGVSVVNHEGIVETIAFSPDGRVLATGSRDQTIKLWSLPDGKELRSLSGHSSAVNLVVFSPNGKRLASGSYDQTIKIWDIATGKELRTFKGHGRQVTAITFSPDGKILASGSALSRVDNPTLHVLAIGIDKYEAPRLMFAVKDAKDISAALEKSGAYGFERVNVHLLLDSEATKQNIIDALNEIAAETKPRDTFVFFFSGYGTTKGEEFHLLPIDGNTADNATFIPASHLSSLFEKIEAQHQMIVLDSPGGDKGFESLTTRIERENRALQGLLQRDLIIFATSMAYDSPKFQNGVLTYAILKGMKGEAASVNGEITGKGLASYLNKSSVSLKQEFPDFNLRTFEVGNDFILGYASRKAVGSQPQGIEYYAISRFVQASNKMIVEATFFIDALRKRGLTLNPAGQFTQQSPTPQPSSQGETRARPVPGTQERPSTLPRSGNDYALLIAVNNYEHWKPLVNPIIDAEAIEKELKEFYGFKTQLLKDPTKQEITRALLKYRREMTFSDDDQLFIFFAGHGYFNEDIKEGYLIAKDSLKDDDVGDSYYSHSILRKVIDTIPCKHIFLVLDACYSGTFDEAIARRGTEELYADATNLEFIRRKMQFKTRRFLTSGDKVYVPDGRPGQHSPFARRLLEALRSYGGRDKLLTINGMLAYIERVTPEPRHGEWGANEPGSDFIFEAKPRP